MSTTIRPKGAVITNPSADVVGNSHFVYCVATSSATTVSIANLTGSDTGTYSVYLHNAGDTIIIEKGINDTITSSSAKVFAVGSPRS